MPIKANKILHTLQEEVTAHGIYHAHYLFPFCDVFHFYSKSHNLTDFHSSFPPYYDNQESILKYFNNIVKEYGWEETPKDLLYVKATKEGFHIPTKTPAVIFSLSGQVKMLTSEKFQRLLNCMAIYDYQLFPYKDREITPIKIGNTAKLVGNRWCHCLHLEEGEEIFYATYS
tara:strand:+ start:66 stop:581 length:516 start_codon:yes stop_codon:yes gene_type:complete